MGLRPHARRNPQKRKPERVRMPPSPGGYAEAQVDFKSPFQSYEKSEGGYQKTAQNWRTFVAASEPSICVFISASAHALSASDFPLMLRRCFSRPHCKTTQGAFVGFLFTGSAVPFYGLLQYRMNEFIHTHAFGSGLCLDGFIQRRLHK